MICLTFRGRSEDKTAMTARCYAKALKEKGGRMVVSDAMPAPLAKARGFFRYQVLMRSASTRRMVAILRELMDCQKSGKDVKITVDVDAVNMM
jgi:primosomal protein N'